MAQPFSLRISGEVTSHPQYRPHTFRPAAASTAPYSHYAMQPRYFGFLNDSRWRLLLKGLPFDATTEEVRSLFSQTASVQSVTLVGKGAEPTGSAIVRFASEVEAVRALKDFRDVYLRKRKIEATLDFTDFSQRIQRVHKPIAVDRYRLPLRFF